jgi:hypothetical protein
VAWRFGLRAVNERVADAALVSAAGLTQVVMEGARACVRPFDGLLRDGLDAEGERVFDTAV